MKLRVLVVATVALALGVGSAFAGEEQEKSNWTWGAIIIVGKAMEEDQFYELMLEVRGDRFAGKKREAVIEEGTNNVDKRKKPMPNDAKFTKGDDKGKTLLGIVEVKDDTMKVCWGAPDKERPKEFSS